MRNPITSTLDAEQQSVAVAAPAKPARQAPQAQRQAEHEQRLHPSDAGPLEETRARDEDGGGACEHQPEPPVRLAEELPARLAARDREPDVREDDHRGRRRLSIGAALVM